TRDGTDIPHSIIDDGDCLHYLLDLLVVVVDLRQVAMPVLHEMPARIADEEPFIREAIADSFELRACHVEIVENLLQRHAEVDIRESTVVSPHQFDRVSTRQAPAAHVKTGEVGCSPKAVLQELEIIVNACLAVVEKIGR